MVVDRSANETSWGGSIAYNPLDGLYHMVSTTLLNSPCFILRTEVVHCVYCDCVCRSLLRR